MDKIHNLLFVAGVLACNVLSGQSVPVRPYMHDDRYASPEYTAKVAAASFVVNGKTLPDLLGQTVDSVHRRSPLKGFTVALNLPDGTVWRKAVGQNSALPGDTLTPDQAMGIGSATKMFTATLMHQLDAEGVVSLDDPLSDWLPPYPNIDSTVTIRQLLNHTSGIFNFTDNLAYLLTGLSDLTHKWTPEEVLAYVQAPLFPPGKGWSYSNTNYLLAALILEKAAGKPYPALVRSRILTPLGLDHTFNFLQDSVAVPVAHLWFDVNFDGKAEDLQGLGYSLNSIFTGVLGAGHLMSTPADLSFFVKKLAKGALLPPSAQAKMFTFDSIAVNPETGAQYGLGITKRNIFDQHMFGHHGYIFYQTRAYYLPKEDLSIAVQSNDANDSLNIAGLDYLFAALVRSWLDFKAMSSAQEPANSPIAALRAVPNPAVHGFRVTGLPLSETETRWQYRMVDARGVVIRSGETDSNAEPIACASCLPGVYFLTLTNGRQSGVVSVIWTP